MQCVQRKGRQLTSELLQVSLLLSLSLSIPPTPYYGVGSVRKKMKMSWSPHAILNSTSNNDVYFR
jgi:hypothetical protein